MNLTTTGAGGLATLRLKGPTTNSEMHLNFTDGATPTLGLYSYSAGAEIFTIKGDGKVGIGTTSPSSSLHIVTASAQTNSPTAGISMGKSAGGDYQLQLTQSGGSPLIDLSRGTNTDFDARISSPADNQLSFGTYSGGNVLNIVAGNVGIGITTL